jgi:hypothetical protein
MEALIFPMVLLGIMMVFGAIFLIVTKKQEHANSINKAENSKGESSKNSKASYTSDNVKKEDVFKFMEFDKILDNMIVQSNGTKFTMAIKCKGINYDLMSDVEQLAVEEGFITFLNTLRYPIQLYVQAQNVDLKGAINKYKQNVVGIKDEFESINNEYNKVIDSFDSTEEETKKIENERTKVLNVYEYASDIIQYVEILSLNKSLLQRNFYVLVSYYTSEITSADKFNKEEIINLCYSELITRAQAIISALSACSVSGEVLNSNELADLLYNAYNRDDKSLLSVKEALDSGFYRLYSTSKDAFDKKTEMLAEEVRNEAKIKALSAIKKSIEEGTYVSPKLDEIDFEEQSSKLANDMIKNEDVPTEIKKDAQRIVLEEYKVKKNKILHEIRDEKVAIMNTILPGEENKGIIDESKKIDNNDTNSVKIVETLKDERVDNESQNSSNINISTNVMQKNNDIVENEKNNIILDDDIIKSTNLTSSNTSSEDDDEIIR